MATLTSNGLKTPLRGHQTLAVDACIEEFTDGARRVSVIMATGTGKTLVALNTVQETASQGNALVVMPTLDLLEQTAAYWQREGRQGFYLGYCSRDSTQVRSLRGILAMVRDPGELARHASLTDGAVNVFCTYQSLEKLARAHRDHHLPRWDIIVADEAHRTAGNRYKAWGVIHDNDVLPARHRLYMTATPRIFDEKSGSHVAIGCEVASMDDHSLYGPVVYRISLAEAIDQGLLADYRIVAVEISDADLHRVLRYASIASAGAEGLRMAAAQIALLRAQHLYDLRRTLTFHRLIASASMFAETLHETAALMPPEMQAPLLVGTVNAKQSPPVRRRSLVDFGSVPINSTSPRIAPHRAVLTNCRCLGEGIDVPSIDSILFADSKQSSLDITQAVGRALRQNPGDDKISTIVVPVFMEPGQDLEEGVKGTRYRLLYQVLIALSTYDEHVIHRVEWATSDESQEDLGVAARPERADEIIPLLDLQATGAPNRVWQIGFESAQRYFHTYGHLDVPSRYLGPVRFYLGWWLGRQRSLRINHMLLPERIERLDTLGMIWPHPRSSIEYKLQIARDYKARHGHLAPYTEESFGGIRLGRWIADRRREANKRTLPYGYQRALNEIYPWWNTHWPKHWHHTYAQALAAARAGNLPFPDLRPDTDETPLTRWLDTQIDALPTLHSDQHKLLGALPLRHPLALLLRRPRGHAQWAFARGLLAARAFWRSHQHLDVPYDYFCPNTGLHLATWLAEKRRDPLRLTQEQRHALEALDFRWIR
ncbi:DEAD/DEAH box helicase [Streptomyces solicathayae]|uniref:Helicase associated domain protein n=1 Tax=Streptomyces solicathayae TaxID=3081768 RepID=A0ABZ0M608_9ACTN|nr:Helicase associated domain protein [Streptomyces sp. HUAS YS2]WOX19889.1 Helicase associated domain protein [Streptomyces sp. HUAS YS2]WOX26489.1 Helicase associated domain protein [Streptomyces sp. HUAS YS2]